MKLKNLLLAVLVFIGSFSSSAQSNLLNAKTPEDIGKKTAAQLESDNDKPLPYGYVHDRDVLMGKMIWEEIDLDEQVSASKQSFAPKTEKAPVKAPAKEVDFEDDDESLSYFAKLAED